MLDAQQRGWSSTPPAHEVHGGRHRCEDDEHGTKKMYKTDGFVIICTVTTHNVIFHLTDQHFNGILRCNKLRVVFYESCDLSVLSNQFSLLRELSPFPLINPGH